MRLLTMWNAYQIAELYKLNAVDARPTRNRGIGVMSDRFARRWQRRDRQSKRFAKRLGGGLRALS